MLKSVKVTNNIGESITLDLKNPEKSGFYVVGIDGLGPPKADLFMDELSSSDGSVFNSARVSSRNIVLKLIYSEKDVEGLRHESYRFFPLKKKITLQFVSDKRTVKINGYVESNEIAIFSKMEGSVISVMCPNPWFIDGSYSNSAQNFSTVESLFEFQHVEESGEVEDQVAFGEWEIRPYGGQPVNNRYIEFSKVEDINSGVIKYYGDIDVGVTIKINVGGNPGNITMTHKQTGDVMRLSSSVINRIVGSNLQNGDQIIISTVTGSKSARLLRGGTYKNIIAAVDKTSNWFKLVRGDNTFVLSSVNNTDDIDVEISSQILYEGL